MGHDGVARIGIDDVYGSASQINSMLSRVYGPSLNVIQCDRDRCWCECHRANPHLRRSTRAAAAAAYQRVCLISHYVHH
jgi:hypothetical protein